MSMLQTTGEDTLAQSRQSVYRTRLFMMYCVYVCRWADTTEHTFSGFHPKCRSLLGCGGVAWGGHGSVGQHERLGEGGVGQHDHADGRCKHRMTLNPIDTSLRIRVNKCAKGFGPYSVRTSVIACTRSYDVLVSRALHSDDLLLIVEHQCPEDHERNVQLQQP